MSNLLLKGPEVVYPDGSTTVADIAITDDLIVHMGMIPDNWRPDTILDCTNLLAVPGFINAHTHAAMTLFRGYADDMLLMDWLQNKIWPIEEALTPDDIYWGTLLAIAEMIKSGTTTFADMYFFMPEVAKAVAESGIRAVLARGIAGSAPNGEAALAENVQFFHDFHNTAQGRIKVMLGPHAPYTCPPDFLKKVAHTAQKIGAEIHIHLSETRGEVDDCRKQYGKTPIALVEDTGIFETGVLAAHCVHISSDDIRIMKNHNVRVAHNPGSNLKLASGIAPLPEMLQNGLCVALGTDGAASNNNLDLLEEMRLTAMIHKAQSYNPLAVPAAQALELATLGGAKALGLNNTGLLQPGYKADISLFDISGPHWYPRHNRISLLTYSAGAADVSTVIVDGKILLQNKRLLTIDEEQVCYEANRRAMNLIRNNQTPAS